MSPVSLERPGDCCRAHPCWQSNVGLLELIICLLQSEEETERSYVPKEIQNLSPHDAPLCR